MLPEVQQLPVAQEAQTCLRTPMKKKKIQPNISYSNTDSCGATSKKKTLCAKIINTYNFSPLSRVSRQSIFPWRSLYRAEVRF